MSTKNITKHNQGELAPSELPDDLRGGLTVEGGESSPQLGRIAMYQGTSQEQQKYGEGVFKRGDFIDVLEGRKLATSRIVVVHCEVIYQRWDKDQARPAYTYTHAQRNLIPAEDLEWDGDLPPACAKMYRCIVLVDGEPWPYLFIVKRTMMKAFDHLLALEARRTATQRGSGLYELGAEDEKNAAGNSYKRLTVRPVGDIPATMFDVYRAAKRGIESIRAKAAQDEEGWLPI